MCLGSANLVSDTLMNKWVQSLDANTSQGRPRTAWLGLDVLRLALHLALLRPARGLVSCRLMRLQLIDCLLSSVSSRLSCLRATHAYR